MLYRDLNCPGETGVTRLARNSRHTAETFTRSVGCFEKALQCLAPRHVAWFGRAPNARQIAEHDGTGPAIGN